MTYREPYRPKDEYTAPFKDSFINRLGIIPVTVTGIGGNWFKDPNTGVYYHVIKDEFGYKVDGKRQSKYTHYKSTEGDEVAKRKQRERDAIRPTRAKPYEKTHLIIKCELCGKEREIKTCDAFQVKRCRECQRVMKNARRKRDMQNQRKREKELKQLAMAESKRQQKPKYNERNDDA